MLTTDWTGNGFLESDRGFWNSCLQTLEKGPDFQWKDAQWRPYNWRASLSAAPTAKWLDNKAMQQRQVCPDGLAL